MIQSTAAGDIEVLKCGKSPVRGGTSVWLGVLPDGRFVVTSRFQYEIRTIDLSKAESKFKELCDVG